jgi:hypothetical protein
MQDLNNALQQKNQYKREYLFCKMLENRLMVVTSSYYSRIMGYQTQWGITKHKVLFLYINKIRVDYKGHELDTTNTM